MHKVQIYPIGNADTCLIKLENDKSIFIDFAHLKQEGNPDDKRCDIVAELENEVSGDFDIVAFTHADDDHIHGFSDFFYLEHAKKYQSDKRKKIKTLWVPAAIILEENLEDEILSLYDLDEVKDAIDGNKRTMAKRLLKPLMPYIMFNTSEWDNPFKKNQASGMIFKGLQKHGIEKRWMGGQK